MSSRINHVSVNARELRESYHLRKVFTKLEITSRADLARVDLLSV